MVSISSLDELKEKKAKTLKLYDKVVFKITDCITEGIIIKIFSGSDRPSFMVKVEGEGELFIFYKNLVLFD